MKKFLFAFCILLASAVFGQGGYEIKVTFKPFTKKYIYLGHYLGKKYPIVDSAMLNEKSEAVFKGNKKLPGGIYLIGYPNKAGFFEILIDKQQNFSVIADTATIKSGVKFLNSNDNVLFNSYQQHMGVKGKQIADAQQKLNAAKAEGRKADSAKITGDLLKLDKEVGDYRNDLIKKAPDNILSVLLNSMKEPQLTGKLKDPKDKRRFTRRI